MNNKEIMPAGYSPYKLLVFAALSHLYVGEGRGEGIIDLMIQKDPIFNIPRFRGSSIKGPIKNMLKNKLGTKRNLVEKILGSDPGKVPTKPSQVMFMDAKLLLFPARTNQGLFNYVTSRWAIQELNSLAEIVDVDLSSLKFSGKNGEIIYGTKKFVEGNIYFFDGELSYRIEHSDIVDALAQKLKELLRDVLNPYLLSRIDYLLLADENTFADIVDTGLLRIARIRLDPATKTVEKGALFFQELVPEYSVFYSYILKTPRTKEDDLREVIDTLKDMIMVVGGDESVGRGLVKLGLIDIPRGGHNEE